MKKINVKLKKLRDSAKIPQYATEQAAACDLCADLEGGKVTINPGEIVTIPTGIAIECEEATEYNTAILIFPRSGFEISSGDRIAQMMFTPVMQAEFEEAHELSDTERGNSGFGSTGIR